MKRTLLAFSAVIIVFVIGNVIAPFVIGYPAIYDTPFHFLISFKEQPVLTSYSMALPDDQQRKFWAAASVFAEEHSFAATYPPFDHGFVDRVFVRYQRHDGESFTVSRSARTVYIGWYSEAGDAVVSRELGEMLSTAMSDFSIIKQPEK